MLEATCSFVFLSSMADTSVKGHAFLARLSRVAYWRSIVRLAWRSRSMRFSRGVFRCLPASASLPRLLSRLALAFRLAWPGSSSCRAPRFLVLVCVEVSRLVSPCTESTVLRDCAVHDCRVFGLLCAKPQVGTFRGGGRLASQSCKTVKSVQPYRFSRPHLPAPTCLLRQKKRPEPKPGPSI